MTVVERRPVTSYRDLVAWQRAVDMAEAVYRLSAGFPREEQFGLTAQLRRSAVSVAANVAEGWGRQTRPAFVSFLRIAQGSLKEVETHLIIAERVEVAAAGSCDEALGVCEELGRILRGLIARMERRT
jgi:four helix bundle protein